ncbi:MAG: amidohydrolase family protein [Candidatus Solibacter usitatus]|nr:amidohydrolase family protein [Candidatus Solibacter usitatus]
MPVPVVDTNVYLSRWPFRRLPCDDTPGLVAKLKSAGVQRAIAGSFDALLHRDIEGINRRLAEECKAHGAGMLMPAGCLNPAIPDWKEDLRRCQETHAMRVIRLHPNYHGYTLEDSSALELLAEASKRKLLVQIACEMEDERTQHPMVRTAAVNPAPLFALPNGGGRVQLLNHRGPVKGKSVWIDIAMTEGVHGIQRQLQAAGDGRVVFGSYFPFFYLESALLKLTESGQTESGIARANALRMLEEPR